jgi:hypothetical protein
MTRLICFTDTLNLTVSRPSQSRSYALADASPMAEATLAWSLMQAAPPARVQTFAEWQSSLDQAFASFHKKRAS